ncbi:SubName: Full=Uncharacterized protein {ECO:0000313/EMBL:CCA75973.1} [Serendipita indica DSM 11827]|nr:SubName: Full=Uncharacterized protein {ECO:0000313/EMBL:CCA75973.1} [Serendipita indica DSM 11827]
MFSRGTRCYLAIAKSDLDAYNIEALAEEVILESIRLLKTSWPKPDRLHEAKFFHKYEERLRDAKKERPRGVPTLLASGEDVTRHHCRGTENQYAMAEFSVSESESLNEDDAANFSEPVDDFEVEEYLGISDLVDKLGAVLQRLNSPSEGKPDQRGPETRRLDWLLLKEVAKDLSSASDSYEFATAMCDAVEVHRSLYEIGRIIHRDISAGNIMIALSTSEKPRGLLIDWEMAKDTTDDQSEIHGIITGTMKYMSLALEHAPLHQAWHDLESFFWFSSMPKAQSTILLGPHRESPNAHAPFRLRNTLELRAGLLRSPETLRKLREGAAERFAHWREILHACDEMDRGAWAIPISLSEKESRMGTPSLSRDVTIAFNNGVGKNRAATNKSSEVLASMEGGEARGDEKPALAERTSDPFYFNDVLDVPDPLHIPTLFRLSTALLGAFGKRLVSSLIERPSARQMGSGSYEKLNDDEETEIEGSWTLSKWGIAGLAFAIGYYAARLLAK